MSNVRPSSVADLSQKLSGINAFLDQLDCVSHAQLRAAALRWLHTQSAFDDAIFAHGVMTPTGAAMHGWIAGERVTCAFDDYLACAAHAPSSAGLSGSLEWPKAIHVARHAARAGNGGVLLTYLLRHGIAHLLIKGVRLSRRPGLAWLILLRHAAPLPFGHAEKSRLSAAMSTVLHACDHACMFADAASGQRAPPARPLAALSTDGEPHGAMALLTDRQQQVLQALMQGWSNKLIARHLAISDNTLKTHLQTIYHVMGVQSRSQAILLAMHCHAMPNHMR